MSDRFFTSYAGVKLPAKMVGEITEADLANRNTYFRAHYDADDRLTGFEQMVYGEVQLCHNYSFHPNGALAQAVVQVSAEDDPVTLEFDENGARM